MASNNPDVTTRADVGEALQAEAIQPLPRKRGEPVFQNSWEAEAYAIGNLLVKEGLISCRQWMDLMASAIQRAQTAGDPDHGDTYYNHWCAALESFCFQMQWISQHDYQNLLSLWAEAIANTPHGVPLTIENAFRASQPHSAQRDGDHGHHHGHDHGHHHAHGHDHGHGHSHSHQAGAAPPEHYWTPLHVTRLNPAKPVE